MGYPARASAEEGVAGVCGTYANRAKHNVENNTLKDRYLDCTLLATFALSESTIISHLEEDPVAGK